MSADGSGGAAGGRPGCLTLLLAFLLPPIGVWLAEGIGAIFLVSLILTCIGYVPGMIFSVVAVLRPDMVERLRGR